MKRIYILAISLVIVLSLCRAFGQNNLLSNGGFEGYIPSGDYPRFSESFDDRNAPSWWPYNNDVDVRWFIDSVWTPTNQNQIDPVFQTGHYNLGSFNVAYPWETSTTYPDSMVPLPAHGGQFYAGFDAKTDGPGRQGVQAKASDCGLNSGNYRAELFWSRAYQELPAVKIHLSLSDQTDSRKYVFDEFDTPLNYTAGAWYQHTASFSIDLNDPDEADNDWFSITGQQIGNSDPRHYTYVDDLRLFRPCDVVLRCAKPHGQICPAVAIQQWPNNPLSVQGIENASDLHLRIYSNSGQTAFDSTYHNGNGLPDYYLSRFALPVTWGIANYNYDLEVSNACGAFKKTGHIQVYDTSYYSLQPVWVDTTAHWSVTPVPCCLNTLNLQNTQIVGNVSYIVRDQITIQNGVSVAPGSHVIIQAGNVVELDSVEFDGTSASVEILEIPCPFRLAWEETCCTEGTSMIIDADTIQQYGLEDIHQDLQAEAPTPPETFKAAAGQNLWASPNPCREYLELGFSLDITAKCSLRLLDLHMRPMKVVLDNEPLPSGDYLMRLDMTRLPAGVYIAQLLAGAHAENLRVVRQ